MRSTPESEKVYVVRDGSFIAALAEGMRVRFPEKGFEISENRLEMIIPNENEQLDGLYIVEEPNEDLMVATGGFIHWHFYCESHDSSGEFDTEARVSNLVSKVLDHFSAIFNDSIIMYSGESYWGLLNSSGTYIRGDRPRLKFRFGKLNKEWCWSHSLIA